MRNKLVYGTWVFEDVKISSGTIGQETSLPSSALAIDTFEAEVKCPWPSIQIFTQNAPVEYFHRGKKVGVYYVQNITRVAPNLYAISAISTLGLVAQHDHHGGIYTGQTVQEVVADICGNIPFYVKSNLQNIQLYGWLPIKNARDNLSQVLYAIGASLGTDHNGVLRIQNMWDGLASVIDADRIYQDGADVERDTPVTSVTVLEHQYIPGTEQKELFSGTTFQGQRIPFSEPAHDLQAEGFTILESNANYAVVSAGSGTLTGTPYVHTTIEITRPVHAAPVPNEERIEDATLVSLVNSAAVASRMALYYACSDTINLAMVLRQEHPGQVVQVYHPFDKVMVRATLASSQIEMSAVLKASVTALVGFEPPQTGDTEYYDEAVILTGEGDWVPPEGATTGRAVIIGAGAGGASGRMGKVAQPGKSISGSNPTFHDRWQQVTTGTGGEGGEPGEGGAPGKILQVELQLQPGQAIHYKSGTPGKGGVATKDRTTPEADDASQPGTNGTDTTFGPYNSANGAVSTGGYYDPITKQIFGAPGASGVAGGPGGGHDGSDSYYGQLPAPDLVVDGVTYHGGPVNTASPYIAQRTYTAEQTMVRAGGYYGAGGGAAVGEDGQKSTGSPSGSISGGTASNATAIGTGGAGARGADAKAPAAETRIGCGGRGGHGGGGAGADGAAEVHVLLTVGATSDAPVWPKTVTVNQPLSLESRGLGSDGSDGAPGGIIVYYRRAKKVNAGAFVTAKKNFFVDKSGRLFIV